MTSVTTRTTSRAPARLSAAPMTAADFSNVTSPVAELCSALSLTLREGDVDAAERLFDFIVDQLADRRLAVTGVIAPLVLREHARATEEDRATAFLAACDALFIRLRRPPAAAGARVGLHAPAGTAATLVAHLLAMLLDDSHAPTTSYVGLDSGALRRSVLDARDAVVCLVTDEATAPDDSASLIRDLRQAGTEVVLLNPALETNPGLAVEAGASAGAADLGEVADVVLRLRGPLTAAEAAVLRLAADGYTNVRIAHELGISVSAVKARLEAGFARIGAADRAHAVAIALRQHWLR